MLYSIVAVRVYIPTSNAEGFQFSTPLPTLTILCRYFCCCLFVLPFFFFGNSHLNEYEVVFSGFYLYLYTD